MVDDAPSVACCQRATPEEVADDPELYQCETCPLRIAQAQLFPENVTAWWLYTQVATRFLVDLHAGGLALERLTADQSSEEFSDLLERLTLLYDVVCPVKTETHD